jgi:hypothetical protein
MGKGIPTFRDDVLPSSPRVEMSLEDEDIILPRNLRIWLPSDSASYPRRTEFSATPYENLKTRTEATLQKIVTVSSHLNLLNPSGFNIPEFDIVPADCIYMFLFVILLWFSDFFYNRVANVYCAVRTGYLTKTDYVLSLKG